MKFFAAIALMIAFVSSGLIALSMMPMEHGSVHGDCGTSMCVTSDVHGSAMLCALHCLAAGQKQTVPVVPLLLLVLVFILLSPALRTERIVRSDIFSRARDPVWLFLRKREFASVMLRN